MGHHNKIIMTAILILGLCGQMGCKRDTHQEKSADYKAQAAAARKEYKPGESQTASVEETKQKHQCGRDPLLLVESAGLIPSKITPGEEIVSRLVYASCYKENKEGKIVRRVVYQGKPLIALPEKIKYKPGTWTLTAYISIPPQAEPGTYVLETEIEIKSYKMREVNEFEVLLQDKGIENKLKINDGDSSLLIAAQNGDVQLVSSLIAKGANVNVRNDEEMTPLLYASYANNVPVVKLLLDKGANVNSQNKSGWTPLNFAAYYGMVYITKLLLTHGAQVNLANTEGRTPLSYAVEFKFNEVATLLRARGAVESNFTQK